MDRIPNGLLRFLLDRLDRVTSGRLGAPVALVMLAACARTTLDAHGTLLPLLPGLAVVVLFAIGLWLANRR